MKILNIDNKSSKSSNPLHTDGSVNGKQEHLINGTAILSLRNSLKLRTNENVNEDQLGILQVSSTKKFVNEKLQEKACNNLSSIDSGYVSVLCAQIKFFELKFTYDIGKSILKKLQEHLGCNFSNSEPLHMSSKLRTDVGMEND